ncbi:Aste57867_11366 [Aphanomyces stellatus]|uniref:Aste57867_11366 protein n=1 Tax=Aphanomyces stellatus TaxID=120398 RepID=A0A485KUM8_9STRA|nr:hypothetical protein As57867_011324 [Aphanomyces stellatus]VFT88228.1 Aste57867_11366 [Aphanomyces stellatus]
MVQCCRQGKFCFTFEFTLTETAQMSSMLAFVGVAVGGLLHVVTGATHCPRCAGGLVSNVGPVFSSLDNLHYLGTTHRDIYDPLKKYRATMQDDGNFVLTDVVKQKPIWAANPNKAWYYFYLKSSNSYVVLQGDGNAVLCGTDGHPFWATNTANKGPGPYCMTVSVAGVLVILDSDCNRIWSHDGSVRGPAKTNLTFEP